MVGRRGGDKVGIGGRVVETSGVKKRGQVGAGWLEGGGSKGGGARWLEVGENILEEGGGG